MFVSTAFVVFALLSLLLLGLSGLLRSPWAIIAAAALLACAFSLRMLLFPHVTDDYSDFLSVWITFFRQSGGIAALGESIGNYNVPYLAVLALLSYINAPDMELIKLVSVFFDVWLAYFSMRLVSHFTGSSSKRFASFFAVLLLPTVMLNGACWAQCDAIYAAFSIAALWLAFEGRPYFSVGAAALAFAFKLQAVFILPVFAVLLFTGRVKLRHLFVFPAVYAAAVLPAVLAGRPFFETLTLYFSQAGTAGSMLNYNSPSVYALFPHSADAAIWSSAGIASAILLAAAVCVHAAFYSRRFCNRSVLTTALIFAVGIPFLLPHMHERYFFLADAISVCYAFAAPRSFPIPVLVSFASLLGYHTYLKQRFLLPMGLGAAALAFVLIALLLSLSLNLGKKSHKSAN